MAPWPEASDLSDLGPTVHEEINQGHREKEEGTTNSARWLTRVRSDGGGHSATAVAVMLMALGLGVVWRRFDEALLLKME